MRELNDNPAKPLVFVYGTLKKNHGNNQLLDGAELIGPGTVAGYHLIDLGHFPAAIPGPSLSSKIHGEVWRVSMIQLDLCDRLEGHPDVYVRVPMHVYGDWGNVTAWGYVLNPAFGAGGRGAKIQGGRWPAENTDD